VELGCVHHNQLGHPLQPVASRRQPPTNSRGHPGLLPPASAPAPNPQDFEALEHAHRQFVATVQQQSLVHLRSWRDPLWQAFSQAHDLCNLVKGARESGMDWDAVQVWCGVVWVAPGAREGRSNGRSLRCTAVAAWLALCVQHGA
jgi:hypothetical protein